MRQTIALDGVWQFAPDDGRKGLAERWHDSDAAFSQSLNVPGCWQAQDVYCHTAWYRRTFSVPEAWRGQRVCLKFGGVSFETEVWVNGQHVLTHEGHMLPFEADVSAFVRFGGDNVIVVRVEQYDYANVYQTEQLGDKIVGVYGCWITWGGIFQSVTLEASAFTRIEHLFLIPNIDARQATARVRLANETDEPRSVQVEVRVTPNEFSAGANVSIPARGTAALDIPVAMGDVTLWSPEQPFLYTADVTIRETEGRALDGVSSRFGMRQIEVRGKQILLNHEPIFLRGWLDDAVYPEQISPTITVEQAREILRTCKQYGFNFVRHHTHIPVVAFHEAADEIGVLQLQEFGSFGSIGNPRIDPTRRTRQQIFETWRGMIARDGNHPSVIAYGVNNECWNKHEFMTWAPIYRDLYRLGKQLDPTRLIIDNSGGEDHWSVASDVYDKHIYQYVTEQEMINASKDRTYRAYIPKREAYFNVDLAQVGKPCLVTEVGGWCSFPDFDKIHAQTGGETPWWLARDMTRNPRMGHALVNRMEAEMPKDLYPTIVANSEQYAGMANKIQVEHMRQTPGISGYAYCTFTDCYNWGAGILDNYFQPKSYAEMFKELNQASVLLWVHNRWCFQVGETVSVQLSISHYGRQPVSGGTLRWRLAGEAGVVAEGVVEGLAVDAFTIHDFAPLAIEMPPLRQAEKLRLQVELSDAEQRFANEWALWVFPTPQVETGGQRVLFAGSKDDFERWRAVFPFIEAAGEELSGVLVTSALTDAQIRWMEAGGRVLWLQRGNELNCRPYNQHPAVDYHATIVNQHPICAAFPNESWCDLQFHHLIGDAVLDTGYFGNNFTPIIETFHVPYWMQNPRILPFRRKGFLAEAQVGRGRLVTTAFTFGKLNSGYPEVKAMARALIAYLLAPSGEVINRLSADDLREWAFGSIEGTVATDYVPFLF